MTDEMYLPMKFDDLSLREVPIEIGGKKYLLKEATADVKARYSEIGLRALKQRDGGKSQHFEGLSETEPMLVSLCLFQYVEEDGVSTNQLGGNVPIAVVKAWPSRIVSQLYERAKKISGLDLTDDLPSLRKQKTEIEAKIKSLEEDELGKSSTGSGSGSG